MEDEVVVKEGERLERGDRKIAHRCEQTEVREIERFHERIGDAAPDVAIDAAASGAGAVPIEAGVIEGRGALRAGARFEMTNAGAAHGEVEFAGEGEGE